MLICYCRFLGYNSNIMNYNLIHIKFILTKKTSFEHYYLFSVICIRIKINFGVVSPQLPVKYPQLPALMIGKIETLIWRIVEQGAYQGLKLIFPFLRP